MKRILALICVFASVHVFAQDCKNYYFLQNNKMVEMTIFNKKGEPDGKLVYAISDVKSQGAETVANVESQVLDKKGNVIARGSSILKCNGGVMMINMKMNMPQQQTQQFSQANVKAEDFYLEYPRNISKGDVLKDGSLNMEMDNNGLPQQVNLTISDRKVEDMEKITTSAGTWDCYKISYKSKMHVKVMGVGVPINMDGTEWYAPGFGIIKSRSKYGGTEITALK